MHIQAHYLPSAAAYPAVASPKRQAIADSAKGINTADTVTITQEAKDRSAASQSGPSPVDRTSHYREVTLGNAKNDPVLAKQMAHDYAYDTSYETYGPLVSLPAYPGAPEYYANTGELVTESNLTEFKSEAAKATSERIALYQAEQAKGTPDADILEKLYSYTDTQPADYLGKLGWTPASAQQSANEASANRAYDFTHMTPAQMQGVAQDLFKSGKIDITQLFMLQNAGVPLGKAGQNGEFIPLSADEKSRYGNTPVNYVQTAKDALAFLDQSGYGADPKSGYTEWKSILATLQDTTSSGVAQA